MDRYAVSRSRCVVTSVDDSGEYYLMYSASSSFDGSQWTDAYPADGGTASIRVVSSNEYIFDAVNPGAHGRALRSHTICDRM